MGKYFVVYFSWLKAGLSENLNVLSGPEREFHSYKNSENPKTWSEWSGCQDSKSQRQKAVQNSGKTSQGNTYPKQRKHKKISQPKNIGTTTENHTPTKLSRSLSIKRVNNSVKGTINIKKKKIW